ncbi:MAG TPA: 4a-hydroxytetrahydrobiopterin dehydratase [Cyanothece sp. UBA12306]|nr:4a-hydroxytetrahydrobiopterin dehydratase [Cyanothece sp. UBA12306]
MVTKAEKMLLIGFFSLFLTFVGNNPLLSYELVSEGRELTPGEITEQLKTVPEWKIEGKKLVCTYQFQNFVEAIAFVNLLVEPAETLGHHPDLMIKYNLVMVSLTTHDLGGISQKDFALAKTISNIYRNLQKNGIKIHKN